MPVQPIPDGYHSITPYMALDEAARAIDFYKAAFNARELVRMPGPGGKIMHAEIRIGDSNIMLSDEAPQMNHRSPRSLGGSPMFLMIYVEDVDALTKQAVAAGATIIRPLENQFYGDRSATVEDPFGYKWTLATHVEDVTPEEMERRMAQMK